MSRSASIQFESIKPHRGDQRWAFEELCFLLFADEFRLLGEAVRREGAGGDGGLEGYIHDGAGRVVVGVQAEVDALMCMQAETAAELDVLLPAVLDRAFEDEL